MRTRRGAESGLEARARAAVAAMLDDGRPSVARLAAAYGLSLRTLQRRLAEQGTSFSVLLEDVRRERAMQRLALGRGSLGALSASLGYKKQSALTRAVRRWTGRPPSRAVRRDED